MTEVVAAGRCICDYMIQCVRALACVCQLFVKASPSRFMLDNLERKMRVSTSSDVMICLVVWTSPCVLPAYHTSRGPGVPPVKSHEAL